MVLSLLILHLGTLKFKALVLTMAFMLSFATDVYICIANLNREDDEMSDVEGLVLPML